MPFRSFQIFKAGTHTSGAGESLTFTEGDLRLTASVYNDTKTNRAPLVLGHPAIEAAVPHYGHFKALIAKGPELWAIADVRPEAIDLVRQKRYLNVSAAFHKPMAKDNPFRGCWSLRHVGLLGAMPPAVKGMARLEFAEAAVGELVEFAEACQWGRRCADPFMDAFEATAVIAGLDVRSRVHFAEAASGRRYGS
jgi:hypothetical protein